MEFIREWKLFLFAFKLLQTEASYVYEKIPSHQIRYSGSSRHTIEAERTRQDILYIRRMKP